MPEMRNKVKYGLKNAHYAPLNIGEDGAVSIGTPVPIPGSVSLTLDAQGETTKFYADDIAYYVSASNDGYNGSFEVAIIPDGFRQDILNEQMDQASQVLVENVNKQSKPFVLLFEFQGDQRAIRHIMYNCTCGRPSVSSQTTNNTKNPVTETMSLTASPLPDGTVKAKTTVNTTAATYNNWYRSVWRPLPQLTVTSEAGESSGTTVLTVSPDPAEGNSYKTKVGATVTLPAYGATVGADWTAWDGSQAIQATTGQQVAVVEVDSSGKVVAGGTATITANGE